MVKKRGSKNKSLLKRIYDEYKEKLWELLIKFIEDEIKNIGGWVQNVTHLKEKIRKIVGSLILLSAGVVVVLMGLAELASSLFVWEKSVSYLFVGFLAIIVAIIYNKS